MHTQSYGFLLHQGTFTLAQALGSHTEAEGAAVVPQILQCQVCWEGPLAANPLSLVAAACPCS